MPFGLMNSQATLQRMLDEILLNVANFRCYVDEVVTFKKNNEDYAIHLEDAFTILKKNGLWLRIKKCSLIQPSLELLLYIVERNGVHFDDQKVATVRDAVQPTTGKEIRSSLVVASYYRQFIPVFAKIAKLLNEITSERSSLCCLRHAD